MNLRTTIFLVGLLAFGAAVWLVGPWAGRKVGLLPKPPSPGASTTILESQLSRVRIRRIEVHNGPEPVVLEKGAGDVWSLPGKWATRQSEADDLVNLIAGLNSRFHVMPLSGSDAELKKYGLHPSQEPVMVKVRSESEFTLWFGEPEEVAGSPFARPTYVRVNQSPEVVRLGPDLLPILRRPREYYQRRQLFPDVERFRLVSSTPSSPFGPPPSEAAFLQLPKAKSITVETFAGKVKLRRVGEAPSPAAATLPKLETSYLAEIWEISEPVKDRVEPDRVRALLTAIPELWVEDFKRLNASTMLVDELIQAPDLGLASLNDWIDAAIDRQPDNWLLRRTGLENPDRTLRVTLPNDDTVVLHIGRISQTKERKGAPPPPNPMMPVQPPPPIIREDYFYARLEGQSQIFEVRGDKFNDLFVGVSSLRDEKLARFKSGDVQHVEIHQPQRKYVILGAPVTLPAVRIVLTKEKDDRKLDRWRIVQPMQALAEDGKISELVDRLAGLEARDRDVLDNADLKATGFEPAAGIRIDLTLEDEVPGAPEPKAGESKPTRKRTVTFVFGKHDATLKKLHVRVAGRERVNLVDEGVLKLAERPALAYRGRRVLDFNTDDVASVEIQRTDESYRLQQRDGDWKFASPVSAAADKLKASSLADDLSRLEAVEYVNDAPQTEDLAAAGLDKPNVTATVSFSNASRKPQSVLIGKQREGKQEYFAKLADGNSIFVVRKELRDKLDVGSLDYRPTQLWTATPDAVSSVKIARPDGTYELKKEGFNWKIIGPFEAPASVALVMPLVDALANPKLAGYHAHQAAKPAEFGLDKPLLEVTFALGEKGAGNGAEKPRLRTLQFGKAVEGKPEVYAKLSDDPAVFRLPESTKINIDKGALELLDRRLLSADTRRAVKLQRSGTATLTVAKSGADWQVEAGATKFPADRPTIDALLRNWQSLQADKFAAYGAQADLAKYGLKEPVDTITLTLSPEEPDGKPVTHALKLGTPVPDGRGDRYAKIDDQPGIAVLSASVVADLARSHLDFVDKSMLSFAGSDLQALRRQMPNSDLELVRDGTWRILKPIAQAADEPSLDDLADKLGVLRADRVADYDTKDLKKYGLDAPAATITLSLPQKDGKPVQHVLKLGAPVDPKIGDGDRFAQVDGSKVIGVLSKMMVKRLLDEPLKFRNRSVVTRIPEPDRAVLERGDRAGSNKAVFSRVEGTWKLTAPLATEAEHADMEDLLNNLYKLRADELVAEKPADLKPYGLDKPEAVWRFFAGDREVLGLFLGKKDATDQRVYAKLTGGDLVFLLEPKVTQQLLSEYRKRALWTGFDAAQVDLLTITGEGPMLTLRKVGGTWQVDGKPDEKLNQDAVTETVSTFSNLKVERFVRDKDAPMDLYGLAKPRRIIVARTTTGAQQEIHLGNLEGGSKRAYARLPGKTEVFTLSDADSAKLDRDAKAFVGK